MFICVSLQWHLSVLSLSSCVFIYQLLQLLVFQQYLYMLIFLILIIFYVIYHHHIILHYYIILLYYFKPFLYLISSYFYIKFTFHTLYLRFSQYFLHEVVTMLSKCLVFVILSDFVIFVGMCPCSDVVPNLECLSCLFWASQPVTLLLVACY